MVELAQDDLQRLLASGPRQVHLVGVAGSGMSGLALLLAQRGHHVTGSDLGDEPDTEDFHRLGIRRLKGHAPEHLGNPDFVSYSSAIPNNNPELLEAQRQGIPVVRRARALAALVPPQRPVIISGTHGKTTTSSMVTHILRTAGRGPSFFIGSPCADLGGSAEVGNGMDFVIEADESDGTMNEFKPHDLVILNIEPEHLDFYKNLQAIERVFEALAASATGCIIYCIDDPAAGRVGRKFKRGVGYGIDERVSPAAVWSASKIQTHKTTTRFEAWHGKDRLGTVTLLIPGRHNVSNALAALAVTFGLGVEFDVAALALGKFHGVRRRFEQLFESEEFLLVDDYAHHPSEVRATIQAARQKGRKRLLAIFQPHRYTRTRAFHRDFGQALDEADRVLITDVYAASEPRMEGVDGKLIADALLSSPKRDAKTVTYEPDLWCLKEAVGCELRKGDLALVMGAGNITQISRALAFELCLYDDIRKLVGPDTVLRRYEPMARHTTMRTGGSAKLWVEPANEMDLVAVLRYCHERRKTTRGQSDQERLLGVTFVGRGSNLLVRDAGISGVTIHLGTEHFTRVTIEGERLVVGAGTKLKQVVMQARRANLTGLEFLEGIPGSVGGALRMNAGAMGNEIFDVVECVRMMDLQGNIQEKRPADLNVRYRSCMGLSDHMVLSAVLKARPGDPGEIALRLKEFEKKRWSSQPAASSSGCVFKNPPEVPAGKVIDELGLKGLSFGHAQVSETHGNFIVNGGGATTSEVLTLISMVRDRVWKERGIDLEMEVIVLGDEKW